MKLMLEIGWEQPQAVYEVGNPYISYARAHLTRKALDAKADTIVYIDHDLSWRPQDLLKLIEAEGQVVAGTYRYKKDEEEYMGAIHEGEDLRPQVRADGCIKAHSVPAGFLKITREGIKRFMRAYPQLIFGDALNPAIDLFNHGAIDGCWFGEDMAFSRRWNAISGEIWLVPDLELTHHAELKSYPGNFHKFMLRQPGGSEYESPACGMRRLAAA